jgi:uncharacterized SAM-binding protein YcdF (DUF218 family)
VLSRYAKEMGAQDDQIVSTGRVSTTEDEARAVASLLSTRYAALGEKHERPRILLVTSAFHMARARELFQRVGLSVYPFPVDFQVTAERSASIIDVLPTAGALRQTENALREAYGRAFYFVVR